MAIGLWAALQIFSGISGLGADTAGGGVAYFAHIGGLAAGLVAGLSSALRRPRGLAAVPRTGMSTRRADGAPACSGPKAFAWRVDREVIVLGGGSCALLMQVAHPAVAAAVAQHSTFRDGPLRRACAAR